jgi:hypothetical protein
MCNHVTCRGPLGGHREVPVLATSTQRKLSAPHLAVPHHGDRGRLCCTGVWTHGLSHELTISKRSAQGTPAVRDLRGPQAGEKLNRGHV